MEYHMTNFCFELEYNEDETGEFVWKEGNSIIIESSCLENAINSFYETYKAQLNELIDWYSNGSDQETGVVVFANSVNGYSLHFRIS